MSKKRGKNRKKQVAPKTKPVAPTTGLTRRDVIIDAGVKLATAVVGGEVVKHLPGPVQTVAIAPAAKPLPATSLGFLWGKPYKTPIIQDNDEIASGGNVTEG